MVLSQSAEEIAGCPGLHGQRDPVPFLELTSPFLGSWAQGYAPPGTLQTGCFSGSERRPKPHTSPGLTPDVTVASPGLALPHTRHFQLFSHLLGAGVPARGIAPAFRSSLVPGAFCTPTAEGLSQLGRVPPPKPPCGFSSARPGLASSRQTLPHPRRHVSTAASLPQVPPSGGYNSLALCHLPGLPPPLCPFCGRTFTPVLLNRSCLLPSLLAQTKHG